MYADGMTILEENLQLNLGIVDRKFEMRNIKINWLGNK